MHSVDRREFCLGLGALSTGLILPSNLQAQSAAVSSPTLHPVEPIKNTMTQAERDARMAWWRAARFGMLIQWGLYSELAGWWHGEREKGISHGTRPGTGEWIMNWNKIPVADYKKLAAHFDPTKFNAEQWVSLAKTSGQKYIIITAKHHDGFAMFDSKANKFNIVDATPFKRDPLKELAIACQRQGIKLGFYYSQNQDWTAPGGGVAHGRWDPAQNGNFDTYLHDKAIPQIKELLNNYQQWGAPVEIWFDIPTKPMTPKLAEEIVAILNKHPNVIWNSRLGGGYSGDFETPEEYIPAHGYPGKDWATCMPINETWAYRSYDKDPKSVKTLLQNLIDIVSKGGNYLLNVGPKASGVIPEPLQERLLAMGKWLRVNGEAIYGTTAGPFSVEHGAYSATEIDTRRTGDHPLWIPVWDWRATAKPGKVYVSIFQWPHAAFTLPPMTARVTRAYMLADQQHKDLNVSQNAGGITVALPSSAPDPIASVLVLQTQP